METNTEPIRVGVTYFEPNSGGSHRDTEWELDLNNQTGFRTRMNVFSAATYIEWLDPKVTLTVDGTELDLHTVLSVIECLNHGHNDAWTADNYQCRVGQVAEIRTNALRD